MNSIESVCIYCGSAGDVRQSHRDAATALGRELAKAGVRLVYGGGRVGMMGLLADATLDAGGEVIGVIPHFLDELEVGNNRCTQLIRTSSMHERKSRMAELSDGFVALPGGLGTLDETFEIVTWRQLGLHDKPVIILDIDGYWDPLRALIDHLVAENYAKPPHGAIFNFVHAVGDILPALRAAPVSTHPIDAKWT